MSEITCSYDDLCQRNLGIFSEEEQERIRQARVVIVGCGGIGGVVAIVLARSGLGQFVLVEHDVYSPSNMNRQIACFSDTLGRSKGLCVKEDILRINPEAQVVLHERALEAADIPHVAEMGDVIVPVMDEWPLSLSVLEVARKTKPAIMAYPVGALGRVSVFTANSPSVAECLAMPYGFGYEQLADYTRRPEARRLLQYYITEGSWREDWFEEWTVGKRPHAQICPMVWITGTLAAQEVVKLACGKWKPVVAPHYWHVTPESATVRKFALGRRLIARLSGHEFMLRRFDRLGHSRWLLRIFTRLLH